MIIILVVLAAVLLYIVFNIPFQRFIVFLYQENVMRTILHFGAMKTEAPAYHPNAFSKSVADEKFLAAHTLLNGEYNAVMNVIKVLEEAQVRDVQASREMIGECADWMTAMLVRFRGSLTAGERLQAGALIRRAKGVS